MFQINRLFKNNEPVKKTPVERRTQPIPEEAPDKEIVRDRRVVSGQRVTGSFHFMMPNEDPFKQNIIEIAGLMTLNVRGCCIYLDESFTDQRLIQLFPTADQMLIKTLTLVKENCPVVTITNLSIRVAQLKKEEFCVGQVLHFINLNDMQLNKLNSICDLYSEPGDGDRT